MSEHDQERELELISAIHGGNSEAANELLLLYEDDIVRRATRLFWKSRNYYPSHTGPDEIAQTLREFLVDESLPAYDTEKNDSFAAWVHTGWNRHHKGEPPKRKKEIKAGSLDAPVGDDARFIDFIPDERGDDQECLDALVDALEEAYPGFRAMQHEDKLAVQELFSPTKRANLRRRGLAIVAKAEATQVKTGMLSLDELQSRSTVKCRRDLLRRLALMNTEEL